MQAKRREMPLSLNQVWAYNHSYLMPYDPAVVISGEHGNVTTPGTSAVVDSWDNIGNVEQEWVFDLA